MAEGAPLRFRPTGEVRCPELPDLERAVFLPSGRAAGGPVCVGTDEGVYRLELDWLTGLVKATPP